MSEKTKRRLSQSLNVTPRFFLKTCTIKDVVIEKQKNNKLDRIVAVSDSTTVFEALQIMKAQNKSSIVITKIDPETGKRQYISLVSSLDLVNWFTWKKEASDTSQIPIGELAGITEETKNLWIYPESQHLDSVIQPFMQGVHALVVYRKVESKRHVYISQWDVIKFIYEHMHFIVEAQEFFNSTVETSKLLDRLSKVISINKGQAVESGFEIMSKNSLRGIAVIDDDGKLVSNLKTSQVSSILNSEKEKEYHAQKIEDFLRSIKEPFGHGQLNNVVSVDTKIKDVLKIVVREHLHRVWVADEHQRPTRVITLSDLIKEIALFDFYRENEAFEVEEE